MAKPTSPIFTNSPLLGMGQVIVANPNRDGTGTLVAIATGIAEGTRIDLVRVVATVATTAGMVRLFLYDGTDTRLLKEIAVTAITPSASLPAFEAEWAPTEPVVLPDLPRGSAATAWELRASTEQAEAINVFAFGGNFS